MYKTFEIKKIEKIKLKYNNLNMSNEVAYKIQELEIANKVLIAMSVISGIFTFIDYIVPDPVPFVDEAFLTGITSLIGIASGIVNKNIKRLANDENIEFTIEDAQKITNQINLIKKKKH